MSIQSELRAVPGNGFTRRITWTDPYSDPVWAARTKRAAAYFQQSEIVKRRRAGQRHTGVFIMPHEQGANGLWLVVVAKPLSMLKDAKTA